MDAERTNAEILHLRQADEVNHSNNLIATFPCEHHMREPLVSYGSCNVTLDRNRFVCQEHGEEENNS